MAAVRCDAGRSLGLALRRAVLRSVAGLVALAVAAATALARAESSTDDAKVKAAVADLGRDDADACTAAAAILLKSDRVAIEWAAAQSAAFSETGWRKFGDAVVAVEPRFRMPVAISLVAAAPRVPFAHREAVLALVTRLVPRAASRDNQVDLDEFVRFNLIEDPRCDADGFEEGVAIRGRAVVPVVIEALEGEHGAFADQRLAALILKYTAQPEDVPALRRLLLAGKSAAAAPLVRLDALGIDAAGDAILEALRKGLIDERMLWELAELPARRCEGTVEIFRRLAAKTDQALSDEEVQHWATLFADLDARGGSPLLASRVAEMKDGPARARVFQALARLGSKDAVAELVRVVTGDPTSAADPAAQTVDTPTGDAEPFDRHRHARSEAALCLSAVKAGVVLRGHGWLDTPDDVWRRSPWTDLEAVAGEVRGWWRDHHESLQFDGAAGRWTTAK